jgi:hypothetical protein
MTKRFFSRAALTLPQKKQPLPQNLWVKPKANRRGAPLILLKVVHDGLI